DHVRGAETRSDVARPRLHDHRERVEPAQIREHRRAFEAIGNRLQRRGDRINRRKRQRAVAAQYSIRMILLAHPQPLPKPSAPSPQPYLAVHPPSTTNVAPVIYPDAFDEARNSTAPLKSSSAAIRPSGVRFSYSATNSFA